MCTFIAGAKATGHCAASSTVVTMSSAIPTAALAMTSALAGAITIASAVSASRIWPISDSSVRLKVSVATGLALSVWSVSGVMNSAALRDIITRTRACCAVSNRTSSAALYAAIPPQTPTTIVLSFSTPIVEPILRCRREVEKGPE